MTHKKRGAVTAGLTAAMLLLLASCQGTSGDAVTDTTPIGSETRSPAFVWMQAYRPAIDVEPYREAILTTSSEYLLLANKQVVLGETYAPAHLATLDPTWTYNGKEVSLEATAARAAEAMIRELHARGYTDMRITSGYRSYAYQSSLFNTYVHREMDAHPGWTLAEAEAQVLTYSARPGTSEHQTGLCLDLISTTDGALEVTFANLPAYAWLVQNAHHFGFILRYPKEDEGITGYSYEPWHYRFVGAKAATEIWERQITLEEYLGRA